MMAGIIITLIVVGIALIVLGFASWDHDWAFFVGVGFITIALVATVVMAGLVSMAEHDRLMAQCLADGHKEYECVGLLERGDATVVVIPVGQ